MKQWYELEEPERIKEVYSKYKIKDFWDFWSDGQPLWMEIRTVDWKTAKEVGINLGLYYSHTGVFVKSYNDLIKVLSRIRDTHKIWAGAQPRKWGFNKWGKKAISGGDNFIDTVKFIFVDIDRKTTTHEATTEELKNCDIVANEILNRFKLNNWHKSYVKICSGNGVQLLIKLDYPITVPDVKYQKVDNNEYAYIPTAEFDKVKYLTNKTIGASLIKYIKKFMKENNIDNVDIDKAGFRMAQVFALPFTKNFKYGGFTWRGVIELENGTNEGLTDYMLDMGEKIPERDKSNIFGYVKKRVDFRKRLVKGKLKENTLVQLMLRKDLPRGERNNYLWFQLKCLIRDDKVDMKSKEFRILHKELEAAYKGNLTLNLPDKRFNFDENIINKFCINNQVPPIYELYTYKKLTFDGGNGFTDYLKKLTLIHSDFTDYKFIPVDELDIEKDMEKCQDELIENNVAHNMNVISGFVKACRKKYGDVHTQYAITYQFYPFFTKKK